MKTIWFKIFFRNSKKNWLNIVVNILGLTLGLAGLLIVLLYSNDEESYNAWNPNKEQVYRISNKSDDNGIWHVSTSAQAQLFVQDIPEVEESVLATPMYRVNVITHNGKRVFEEKTIVTQPNFFNFFPFEFIEGSKEKFSKSRNHIAISESLAKSIFDNEKAVGETIKINKENYVVTGVYTIPGNSHFEPGLLMQFSEPIEFHWGNYNNELFVKLSDDATSVEVKKKMDQVLIDKKYKKNAEQGGITLAEYEEKYGFMEVLLEQLVTIRLHHKADNAGPGGKGNYELLLMLFGLSILLIIISCVNFVNLSTASASQRAKEVGVKKTLGVSKNNLRYQYVLEIVLQALIALVLAVILVELILPSFNKFIAKDLSLFTSLIVFQIAGVALVIAVLIAVLPAVYYSNFKTTSVLKGNFSRSKKGIVFRNVMLGVQFLISGFFLIGVLVVYNQIDYMMNKEIGFDKEQVLVVDVFSIEDEYQKYKLTQKVLEKHKNITGVTTSLFVPGNGYASGTNLEYNDIGFNSANNLIDYNYPDFANIKIIKGRTLAAKYASDTITSILINETAAKKLGIFNDPIGKKVKIGWVEDDDTKRMEVVGMFKDYHVDGFDTEIGPMFMMHLKTYSFATNWLNAMQFKIKTDNVAETIADIETFWKQNVDNEYPFSYEFLDKKFAKTYDKYEKQQTMFLVLSITVILMSLLGLFALSTLTIQQRLKEVAIRKTLGASVKEIMVTLIKKFLMISAVASVILLPFAFYLMQLWLDNFVYRIEMPVWPYIVTPIVLFVLVILVVGYKAYRATKVDLIKYLKFE